MGFGERGEVQQAGRNLVVWLALAGSMWSWQSAPGVPDLLKLPQLSVESLAPPARTAVQQAFDAAAAHPRDAGASGRLGMVLYAHSLFKEAEICFQRARHLDPASVRWAYYLGLSRAALESYEEAVAALTEAVPIDPGYLPVQLALGELLLATARWEEAARIYEATAHKHPASAEAHYGLGRARAARGELVGAAGSFQKACELFPNFSPAHYALAQVYRRLGKTEESLEHLAVFDSNKSSRPPAEDRLLDEITALRTDPLDHLRRGLQLAQEGKPSEAEAALLRALEIDPNLVPAHVNLISIYGRLGKFREAEKHYKLAANLDARNAKCYAGYSLVLAAQGRFAEAEEAVRKALEIDPAYPDARANLGQFLEAQSRPAEALAEYRKTLEANPGDARMHFGIGRILVNQERYDEGIQHLLKSLETRDENSKPSYLYAVGAAYARAGRREEGFRYLRQAREQAAARGQSGLVKSIDEDLRFLEGEGSPR